MIPFNDRYKEKVSWINEIFSEEAYLKTIFEIEIAYFKAVTYELRNVNLNNFNFQFSYDKIKKLEETTKHDIVAVVQYIKSDLNNYELGHYAELVHFGLTSQDVVALAYPMMLQKTFKKLDFDVCTLIDVYGDVFNNNNLIGYTHGQKATPILGSNLRNILFQRTILMSKVFQDRTIETRFLNGACGDGYSLFKVLDPFQVENIFNRFVGNIGIKIKRAPSRQTDYYPSVVSFLKSISDLSREFHREAVNCWLYCSNETLKHDTGRDQVGSSAMSQKINPINFENAEGNFELAYGMSDIISNKLVNSRLDRDLSELTMLRNLGLVIAYFHTGVSSLTSGLKSVSIDSYSLAEKIDNSHEMLSEAVMLVLKINDVKDSQKICVDAFKGKKNLDRNKFVSIIDNMDISIKVKKQILKLEI